MFNTTIVNKNEHPYQWHTKYVSSFTYVNKESFKKRANLEHSKTILYSHQHMNLKSLTQKSFFKKKYCSVIIKNMCFRKTLRNHIYIYMSMCKCVYVYLCTSFYMPVAAYEFNE